MSQVKISEFFKQLENADEYHFEGAKLDFALELKSVMERENVSGVELASRLGVSAPMVSKLLRGDANVTLETMVKLSRSLGGNLFVKIVRKSCTARLFELAQIEQHRTPAHRIPPGVFERLQSADAWNHAANDYDSLGHSYEAEPIAA